MLEPFTTKLQRPTNLIMVATITEIERVAVEEHLVVRTIGFLQDLDCICVCLCCNAPKLRAHNPSVGAVVVDVGGRQAGSGLPGAVPLLDVPILQQWSKSSAMRRPSSPSLRDHNASKYGHC